jgi:hypothetical protein
MSFGSDLGPERSTGFTHKGREITLSKSRGRPFNGLIKKGMERGIYPDQKYIEAATLYAVTGSFKRVSELTDVPAGTIRAWTQEARFKDLLREIRQENNEVIDAKFTEIVEKSCDLILDRFENGDHVWDAKSGQLIRRPINAKDLSQIGANTLTKRQLIRGEPTARVEQVSEDTRLERLAEQFTKIANQFKEAPKLEPVIDVESTKVIEGEIVK